MVCSVDGISVRYIDEGPITDIAVVIFHGWGCDIDVYRPIIEIVKSRYRVIALQLPGFGQSDEPPFGWTMEDYAKFSIRFLESINAKHVILIGHSLGTRMLIRISTMDDSSLKIDKMVFIDGAGILPKRLDEYLAGYDSFKRQKDKLMLVNDKESLELLRTTSEGDYAYLSETMCKVYLNAVTDNLENRLHLISIPTLLIWGEKDEDTPLSDGMRMKELIPDAGMIVLKDSGHYSFLDSPFIFNRVIKSFLNIA